MHTPSVKNGFMRSSLRELTKVALSLSTSLEVGVFRATALLAVIYVVVRETVKYLGMHAIR
jgi:hypothetical protein